VIVIAVGYPENLWITRGKILFIVRLNCGLT